MKQKTMILKEVSQSIECDPQLTQKLGTAADKYKNNYHNCIQCVQKLR